MCTGLPRPPATCTSSPFEATCSRHRTSFSHSKYQIPTAGFAQAVPTTWNTFPCELTPTPPSGLISDVYKASAGLSSKCEGRGSPRAPEPRVGAQEQCVCVYMRVYMRIRVCM